MPFTSTKAALRQVGFTLVEVLVVAPFVILLIGAFVVLATSLTGESLRLREQGSIAYNAQDALDDIETNAKRALNFLSTTGSVAAPQGKNDSTTPFTYVTSGAPDTLIIRQPATKQNPYNTTRDLVYTGATCDPKNPVYTYMSVYYVDNGTLWRRTIIKPAAACTPPWQQNSCSAAGLASSPGVCKLVDEKILENVKGLTIKYYKSPGDPESAALTSADQITQASTIAVTLSLEKKVAGKTLTYSAIGRATSTNTQGTDVSVSAPPPANPPISATLDYTTYEKAKFEWTPIGNATSYNISYRTGIDGAWGAWTNGPQNTSALSFSVDLYRRQVAEVKVTANSNSGTYDYGTVSYQMPSWHECSTLQNGWQNYGGIYNSLGFTKTRSGAVGLKGLVRYGNVGFNYPVCKLPAGYAPQDHLILYAVSNGTNGTDGAARIDIWPDGNIAISATPASNNGWVSLDGIIYMTASGNPAWQTGTWQSGWYFFNYNDTYSNLKYWKDGYGRVWVQGLGTGGTQLAVMATLPTGMSPNGTMHIPAYSGSAGNAVNMVPVGGGQTSLNSRYPSSWVSTQYLYYATSGLRDLTLYNGWSHYGSGYTMSQCYKGADDIVVVQGLVRAGTGSPLGSTDGCGGSTGTPAPGSSADTRMSTGKTAILPVWANWEKNGRIDLSPDNYLYTIISDPGWTSLDGIHYIAG